MENIAWNLTACEEYIVYVPVKNKYLVLTEELKT